MFERFTEKARRVIFFARYEASQYGSPVIDSEHLLLGLVREDHGVVLRFMGEGKSMADIRTEIEKRISRRESFSTAVEVPLAMNAKKILNLAMEESEKLGHRHVGTEHLLLGMLMAEDSCAAQILRDSKVTLDEVRQAVGSASGVMVPARPSSTGLMVLERFLVELRESGAAQISTYFAEKAQLIDCRGRRWTGVDGSEEQFEGLFAPYTKRSGKYRLESADAGPGGSIFASVLWENVIFGGESTRSMQRMTLVLAKENEEWVVLLLQVTPVVAH